MSFFQVFDIAGSAMSAQSVRLNVTASNIANADSASSDPNEVYRSRQPVFATFRQHMDNSQGGLGVRVLGIVESQAPARSQYQPDHPQADESGYVYFSNVNALEEMVNMMTASRSYQNNVEVINTSKDLLLRTLSLGQ